MSDDDSNVPDGFRIIPGFPRYAINKNGDILSVCGNGKQKTQSWHNARRLKNVIGTKGYRTISLCRDRRTYLRRVPVLVLKTFVGPCPIGMQCRHIDGNKANNHLDNLKWGTPRQNYNDMVLHGTNAQGERHGNAKMTEDTVLAIRERRSNGFILRDIASEFNVSISTISRISRQDSWKHI